MENFRKLMIAEAAKVLHSTEFAIKCEAANIPYNSPIFSTEQSLQKATQLLVNELRIMRNAEIEYFRSHPELNP